jgi:hypothetical protein
VCNVLQCAPVHHFFQAGVGVYLAACTYALNRMIHLSTSASSCCLSRFLNYICGTMPANPSAAFDLRTCCNHFDNANTCLTTTLCMHMPCSYVLWKVVARHLPTPQKRTAFCAAVGGGLLQQLAPDSLTSLQQQAAAAPGGWECSNKNVTFQTWCVRIISCCSSWHLNP